MTIDIRAVTSCSLGGNLISATISDDYIQGNGVVRVKGRCEIAGILTPAQGDPVTFTYTKNGVTRTVPRKLRVLSSFCDPFRRITTVELGCKLTLAGNLKQTLNPLTLLSGYSGGVYLQNQPSFSYKIGRAHV